MVYLWRDKIINLGKVIYIKKVFVNDMMDIDFVYERSMITINYKSKEERDSEFMAIFKLMEVPDEKESKY